MLIQGGRTLLCVNGWVPCLLIFMYLFDRLNECDYYVIMTVDTAVGLNICRLPLTGVVSRNRIISLNEFLPALRHCVSDTAEETERLLRAGPIWMVSTQGHNCSNYRYITSPAFYRWRGSVSHWRRAPSYASTLTIVVFFPASHPLSCLIFLSPPTSQFSVPNLLLRSLYVSMCLYFC